ncbi:hypothetical protein [Variovorax sp. 38R]|uniref:hypothetical protein n=1 Tax=Variovorax sp. 38R TaxID=2774875 RepID=UPI0017806284|nr:hypothetical protein [Variovorax sp. 38R]QOF76103.1 hypothetical protein IG196_16990 [Variovorax sp. 38R]
MSVRLVNPPRPQVSAATTPTGFPPAANDEAIGGLWFPSTRRDNLVVGALVVLLILAAVLLGMYGEGPRDSWFSLWGIAK